MQNTSRSASCCAWHQECDSSVTEYCACHRSDSNVTKYCAGTKSDTHTSPHTAPVTKSDTAASHVYLSHSFVLPFIDFIFVFFSVTFLLWHVSVTFSFYLLLIVSLTFFLWLSLTFSFCDSFCCDLSCCDLFFLCPFHSVALCFFDLFCDIFSLRHVFLLLFLCVTFLSVTFPFYVYKYMYIYIYRNY